MSAPPCTPPQDRKLVRTTSESPTSPSSLSGHPSAGRRFSTPSQVKKKVQLFMIIVL